MKEAWQKRKAIEDEDLKRVVRVKRELVKEKRQEYVDDILKLEDPKHKPQVTTVWALLDLLDQGHSLADCRHLMMANDVPDKTWDAFKRFIFKAEISQPEDLGLNALKARKRYQESLIERINHLKDLQKRYPKEYHREIMDCETRLFKVECEMADLLQKIGVVGDRSQGTNIVVINNIPRPDTMKVVNGDSLAIRTEPNPE